MRDARKGDAELREKYRQAYEDIRTTNERTHTQQLNYSVINTYPCLSDQKLAGGGLLSANSRTYIPHITFFVSTTHHIFCLIVYPTVVTLGLVGLYAPETSG